MADTENDYDDEVDEDDDDEDDEDYERAGGAAGRTKRMKRNPFILDTAEEGSDEDDYDEDAEEGFEEVAPSSYEPLPPRRTAWSELKEKTEEELLRELEERHRQSDYIETDERSETIRQQSCLPTVRDPKLWMVKCKLGKEREAVVSLLQKFADKETNPDSDGKLLIKSAICCDQLPGYIYVEAEKEPHVRLAIRGLRSIFQSQVKLVPIKEMVDVLTVGKKEAPLPKNAWVRVKRGVYARDLGQVFETDEARNRVIIKLIPRLDLNAIKAKAENTGGDDDKPKQRRMPPRFFNPAEITQMGFQVEKKRDTRTGEPFYIFEGNKYKDGYLFKAFNTKSLDTKNISPTLDELQKFQERPVERPDDQDDETLESVALAMKPKQKVTFMKGDMVKVVEGDLKHLMGTVESVEEDTVTIMPKHDELNELLTFPASQLQKHFNTGDHVKVIAGKFEGETGLIIRVDESTVIILSDLTMKEIPVLIHDIQECSEVTSGKLELGNFELHDLVQIGPQSVGVIVKVERDSFRVLDCNDKVSVIRLQEMGNKRNSKNATAFDQKQNPIQVGDVLVVLAGPHKGRQGTVKHLYRYYAFLHSKDMLDNSGIYVVKTSNCQLLGGSKHSTIGSRGFESAFGTPRDRSRALMSPAHSSYLKSPARGLAPQNPGLGPPGGPPHMGRGRGGGRTFGGGGKRGRDDLATKTVRIIGGMWKGYIGIVREATDTTARVELHTKCKTVTVQRDIITVIDPETKQEIRDPSLNVGHSGQHMAMAPSSVWDGGRTPLRSIDDATATPLRMATPMRVSTPLHGSDPWNPQAPTTPMRNDWPEDVSTPHAWTPSASGSETVATPGGNYTAHSSFSPFSPGTALYDHNTPDNSYNNPSTPSGAYNHYTPSTYSEAGTPHDGYSTTTPQSYPTTPSTPGSIITPQLPGTPAEGFDDAAAQGRDDIDQAWHTTDVEVSVVSGEHSGQKGVIREVFETREGANCSVELQTGRSVVIPGDVLEPIPPRQKKDRIKVIRGDFRGNIGVLMGIDRHEAIVKLEKLNNATDAIRIIALTCLARYVDPKNT